MFILLLGPLIFFDLSKSKWLQLFTAVLRNISLILMILIAGIHIVMGKRSSPQIANFSFIPNLFGVIIYAFMCQHSIPGMITPLNTKRKVNLLLFVDYLSILCYYATLAFTAAFRLVYFIIIGTNLLQNSNIELLIRRYRYSITYMDTIFILKYVLDLTPLKWKTYTR